MNNNLYKEHWENIYQTKDTTKVSWFQESPQVAIDIIKSLNLKKDANILDVGGGDSNLVDFLLAEGFENIYVLDISESAILKAKERLGNNSIKVNWVVSNILDFKPSIKFDLWHDRAAFHFLTNPIDVEKYVKIATESIYPKGFLTIATFSEKGPDKCSGIEIKKYSELELNSIFEKNFDKLNCIEHEHNTPSGSSQSFIFCRFIKK